MKCLDQEQLFAYAHRLLEQREEETARAHVDTCPRCRAALEEYARLDAVLDEWKPSEPSPWFDARLRQALASWWAWASGRGATRMARW
jgi:anti-sigma factor ChrR (cupin superfamily)